ncbi:MAG: YhbY family RNA-binding protein [Oscillospiraceae bacterium]|nr:YhbY family RNA-binding protein [Oscillospiraceae bacterium]
MTSKQRAALRAQANELRAIIQIGKQDIGDNLISQVDGALETRELVKCHVLETSMLSAREAAAAIAEATGSEVVQVIGTRFVLYRESKTLPKDKRIELV